MPLDATVASLPGSGEIDISTQGIDALLSCEGTAQRTLTRELQETHAIFDPKTYKVVLLEYLMANNLLFAHVDSPSLAKLLSYRRCETSEIPSETRHLMRADLDKVYRYSLENLKSWLAAYKGRLALTLDERKPGNNYNFLAVTLHFQNDDFELEKFVIRYEVSMMIYHTGSEVLYVHLSRVLNEYDIKDHRISITRDNAAPINTLIDGFKGSFNKNDTALEFSGDIRCAGHMLNLTTNTFLICNYFKASKSKIFLKSLVTTKESYHELEDTNSPMEDTPNIVSSIIKEARNKSL